jgi:hypothetical protein
MPAPLPTPLPQRVLLCLLAVVALVGALLSPGQARAATTTASYSSLVQKLADTDRQVLASYIAKDSPSDTRFYDDGVWMDPSVDCWTCFSTAATAAAIMSREGSGDAALQAVAVRTFNRSIDEHQNGDGSFSGTSSGPGIDTAFWAAELGIGYFVLQDRIPAATRTRWATSIGRAADYLIAAGHTKWYANGNINLRYAEVLYLAWKATGETRFKQAYDAEWDFVLSPPQPRWAGYGLQMVKQPTNDAGTDGAAYLAEAATGAPGYDPAYTMVQLDNATELYVMSKDPRALRLMNLTINQLLKRVDAKWTLDALNGSRKSYITPFMTPALSVLARTGTRPDLVDSVAGQHARTIAEFRGAMTYTHPNFYKGLASWLSMPILDRQLDGRDFAVAVPVPLAPPAGSPAASAAAPLRVTTPAPPAPAPAPKAASTTAAPAATWKIAAVKQRGRQLVVDLANIAGSSKVSADLYASARSAKAASSRPLRHVAVRQHAGRFAVRIPLKAIRKATTMTLKVTVVDKNGRRVVTQSVRVRPRG